MNPPFIILKSWTHPLSFLKSWTHPLSFWNYEIRVLCGALWSGSTLFADLQAQFIWVYTVCPDLPVWKLRIIMVLLVLNSLVFKLFGVLWSFTKNNVRSVNNNIFNKIFSDQSCFMPRGIQFSPFHLFVCSFVRHVRGIYHKVFTKLDESFSSGVYLTNYLSESIHIWTIGTLEAWLSFHDSWPQGPCPRLEVKI